MGLLTLFGKEDIPTPRQLSGLQAWYDFSQSAYLTLISTAITQALDRSGNGNHTAVQGTSTARPTWTSNSLNGLPGATFDGTTDYLTPPSAIRTAITRTTAHTMFYVFKSAENGASIFRNIINAGKGGAGADMLTISLRSDILRVGYYNGSAYSSKSTAFTDTTTGHVLSVSHAANTAPTCLLDGATMSGTDTPAGNVEDAIKLGGETQDDLKNFSGVMYEILIYDRVLSSAEITQVELYLANKWGLYHPQAGWINAYSAWKQVLIHAWKISKDNAFTNTTGNPFAAIYDPSTAALGATTSLADSGRGVNTATEATDPPVNTAAAIGTANGLLYNGTTTVLNAGSNSTIDDIFAAGGCFIGVINPTTAGENASATTGGRIFDKTNRTLMLLDPSGGSCSMRHFEDFSTTDGSWKLMNRDITLGANNIIAITYNASNVANNPTMYVNSLTAKAITTTTTPVGTAAFDAANNMLLGNNVAGDRTFDGYKGKYVFLKSVPTTAQLTAVFNFLATEYGVTLT